MCIKGKTRRAPKKKRKKYLQQGATRGKCPRTCTPVCTPGICGDDSCGGTCGCTDRTICVCGACEVCDIACTSGDSVACGEALNVAIASGGTILVCPSEHEGQFPLTEDVEIIGAGSGDNPATSTILVGADGLGSVVPVTTAVTARLASLRVTGGNGSLSNSGGVNINNAGADVSIEDCALVGNRGNYGGGVSVYRGALAITGIDISRNTAAHGGGIATATLSTVESTTITYNEADGSGGGVFLNSGTVNLGHGVTITTNTALGGAGTGGGIYQFSAGATINNAATVTNNNPDNCAGNSLIC
ncbi:MAG: hypothetical protein KC442_14585 [Thermomicrobiales bacterium]|nr:hypothetical protein [Thermomicrobiales bacterium]